MAGSQQISVGTTATSLVSAPAGTTVQPVGWFYIANGATQIYVGGPGVSTANGVPLAATTGTMNGWLFPGDQLYAVTSSGSSTVSVLTTGV